MIEVMDIKELCTQWGAWARSGLPNLSHNVSSNKHIGASKCSNEMGEKIDAILTRYDHLYNKKVFIEFYVKNKLIFDLAYELHEDYVSIMQRIEDVEDFIAKNLSD